MAELSDNSLTAGSVTSSAVDAGVKKPASDQAKSFTGKLSAAGTAPAALAPGKEGAHLSVTSAAPPFSDIRSMNEKLAWNEFDRHHKGDPDGDKADYSESAESAGRTTLEHAEKISRGGIEDAFRAGMFETSSPQTAKPSPPAAQGANAENAVPDTEKPFNIVRFLRGGRRRY